VAFVESVSRLRRQARDRGLAALESERRFSYFAESAPVGIFETDEHGDCTFVNPRWLELAGIPASQALGRGWLSAIHSDDRERVVAAWSQATGRGIELNTECRLRRADPVVWVSLRAVAIGAPDGSASWCLGTVTDITELKQANARLEELAFKDDLTGLLNRRAVLSELDRHLHEASLEGSRGALLMIDVDRLKAINDSLGHHAGDRVLTRIGQVLSTARTSGGVAGRLGGDEFAVFLPGSDAKAAAQMARTVLEALNWPEASGIGGMRSPTASIGVALVGPGTTRGDLLTRADEALYTVKGRGGAGFAVDGPMLEPRRLEAS
jgi:diguanylate cyclase (GGDEF)-like protein/PAS domain S-box-containing protein